jgi:tetratricopeptide (TPR) repeat protein
MLYLIAVAQRYQRKLEHAGKTLRELLSLQPENARAWQERGHVCLSENDLEKSRTAYEQAVRRNPALLASWKALINLYDMAGLGEQLNLARQEVAYLESLPDELLGVLSLLNDGRLFKADQLCRHFLRSNKQHVEGMRLLAMIGEQLGVLMDAEFLLETALELEPGYPRLRYDYANLLLKMQKFEKAREETARLVAADPESLRYLALHANALAGVGEHEAAIEAYNTVIGERRGQFVLHVMRGHAEKTIGRLQDAIASYQAASEMQPLYGDAFWSLANTKTYRFAPEEIEHMRRAEADGRIGVDDRIHMCFALGRSTVVVDKDEGLNVFQHSNSHNGIVGLGSKIEVGVNHDRLRCASWGHLDVIGVRLERGIISDTHERSIAERNRTVDPNVNCWSVG